MMDAPFSRTFIELVREQAIRLPLAIALVCAQGRFSYGDLAARAANVAAALQKSGVGAGDRVGLKHQTVRSSVPVTGRKAAAFGARRRVCA